MHSCRSGWLGLDFVKNGVSSDPPELFSDRVQRITLVLLDGIVVQVE